MCPLTPNTMKVMEAALRWARGGHWPQMRWVSNKINFMENLNIGKRECPERLEENKKRPGNNRWL